MNKKTLINDYTKTEQYKRAQRKATILLFTVLVIVFLFLSMTGDQNSIEMGILN